MLPCDFGRAILNAVAEIFGRCSDLPAYLQKCYNVVVSSTSNDLPATYIRLDVSHLIAMVSRWKCLKTKVLAARRLYLRCIAQAYQMSDFKTLSYFLESILAVALSEYLGTTKNDIVVPAQIRMEVLDRTIEGVAFTDLNADDNEAIQDKDNASDNDILEDDTSDWKTWTNTIYATAQDIGNKSKEGTIINACFNPDFALRLKKQLIPYLPLWTGIMRLHFGIGSTIATSSSVESEFNDLKNRAFKNQLPMRIDKFVFQHLDHLESKLILASHESDLSFNDDITEKSVLQSEEIDVSEHCDDTDIRNYDDFISEINSEHRNLLQSSRNESKLTSESNTILSTNCRITNNDVSSSTSDACDLWNTCENWRGLTAKESIKTAEPKKSPPKKKSKPTYLEKCPEWQFVKDSLTSKLPIFKNGSFCKPVSIGKYKLNVKCTCAFDSLFQVIMSSIASNTEYHEKLSKSTNQMIRLALKVLHDKKLTMDCYKERAEILSSIGLFKCAVKWFTRTIKQLNAECNVSHLAEYLFVDIPSCKIKGSCLCGYNFNNSKVILSVNVDVLLCEGFGLMQKAIDNGQIMKRTCKLCKSNISDKVEYGSHVIIDTCVLTDNTYTVRNTEIRHDLDSIAKTIEIKNKNNIVNRYLLTGLVHWSPGHYIAYVKSGMYWHEYNDVGPVCRSVNPRTEIKPHLIFYTLSISEIS